jgi:ATP-dependent helicase/DNAse subunit B
MQKAELLQRLEETVAALAEVSQGWRPFKQELMFGMGAPSLVLETEAGPVRLHGYIDRVDAADDGSLRVIDYKTGGATISAVHLRDGRRLQLPIYALAAQKALGLGQVTSGFYWHIQKAEASSLKLEKFEDGINSAFAVAIAHVGRHVNGIRAGKFAPKPPAEGCPSYCPAANFCWRYKKGF